MRCLLLGLGFACVLGAQVPLHILAVERKGPPPYEAADRIYRLDGGQNRGLRVGDRLLVKRSGEPRAIGHLRVVEVRGEQCEARFEPSGSVYPMKGDLVLRAELKWPPVAGPLDVDPLPMTSPPAPSSEAPPQEGLLFFLPQQADLSPAGLKKLEAWVRAWGGWRALGRPGPLGQGPAGGPSEAAGRGPPGGSPLPGRGAGQG